MATGNWASRIFDDLAAEYAEVDRVLGGLAPEDWARESAAAGWTVSDVVLHLAQSDELVRAAVAGDDTVFNRGGRSVDEAVDLMVAAQRGRPPAEVLARWREASRAALADLRACPPDRRLSWAAVPLSPRTLATTRLAEYWAHALDITTPLGIAYPATDRGNSGHQCRSWPRLPRKAVAGRTNRIHPDRRRPGRR